MRRYKKFYHLHGIIEVKQEGEMEVRTLFANEAEAEAKLEQLEIRYEHSPNLIKFDVKYDVCSLQEIFELYTVEEICKIDKDFEFMIRSNIEDLTRIED